MLVATREIRIETVTACNFRCAMCPRDELLRKQEIMPNDLFGRIVAMSRAELPHLEVCTLSGFGEFSADPQWRWKLGLARQNFARVHVVTNLSLIEEHDLGALFEQATEVRVSLSAVDEAAFRAIHHPPPGIDLAMIERRIRRLAELRPPGGLLRLTCCRLTENHDQIPRWIEKWNGVADLEVWEPHNWVDGRSYRTVEKERLPTCGRPATGPIQVQADGTVNLCCFDFNNLTEIGDLRRQSFAEVLGGPALEKYRTLHATGRADEIPACRVCDQREPPERRERHLVYCSWTNAGDRVRLTSSGLERWQ